MPWAKTFKSVKILAEFCWAVLEYEALKGPSIESLVFNFSENGDKITERFTRSVKIARCWAYCQFFLL